MRLSDGRVVLAAPRVLELYVLLQRYKQPLRNAIRAQPISRKTAYEGQIIGEDYFLTVFQIVSISKKEVWLTGLTDFDDWYPFEQRKAGEKTYRLPEALDAFSYIIPEQLRHIQRLKRYSKWIELIRQTQPYAQA